ncbi:MAG: 50S ribosomal protein L15 [Pirellulaceae bacterium]|nr:50S ribosomal protein L15 [Pirellulaceae bacterium]
MRIDQANQNISKHRRKLRVGRGKGAGQGKLCGRGQDGHKSRSGYSRHPGMVGEDLPMIRRVPKRGFNNSYALDVVAVNVGDISAVFASGQEVTPQALEAKGLVKCRYDALKILADGDVDKPLQVAAHRFSAAAEQKIKAAGGSVTKLRIKRTPRERVTDLRKAKA